MNKILIKNLYASTLGLEECRGKLSKYFKAWNIFNSIDRERYNTMHIGISAGENTSIATRKISDAINDPHKTESLINSKKTKKEFGTLKANMQYNSKPVEWNEAYDDLERLCSDTGIDFKHDMHIVPYTKRFNGKWSILSGFVTEMDKDLLLAAINSDITSVEVSFVGVLSSSERDELSSITDELYLPKLSGYKYEEVLGKRYKHPMYTTDLGEFLEKHKHAINTINTPNLDHICEYESNMPIIVAKKKWIGFDENEIEQFYNAVKSYEKIEHLRTIKNIWYSPNPKIKIAVASMTAGKPIYALYVENRCRGIGYTGIAVRNDRKDIMKEENK